MRGGLESRCVGLVYGVPTTTAAVIKVRRYRMKLLLKLKFTVRRCKG